MIPPTLTESHAEGIFHDYPEDKYRAAPGVCQSDLKEMGISPAHFLENITRKPKPPTPAQKTGTLTHALILCGRQDFAVIPDSAPAKPTKKQWSAKDPSKESKDAMNWWRTFMASFPGKREFLSEEEAANILGMQAAVKAHPIASEILSRPGNNEVACWKRDEETGLLLRGRADRVCMDNQQRTVIPDLKTVQRGGAGYDDFSKDIFNWQYHLQSAFYLDLFGASFFVFIVVEKEPPYVVRCYNLDASAIQLGRETYRRYLRTVKACVDSDSWPAYNDAMETISLPKWAK